MAWFNPLGPYSTMRGSGGRTAGDASLGIAGAQPGEVAEIAEVDACGRPLSWVPADYKAIFAANEQRMDAYGQAIANANRNATQAATDASVAKTAAQAAAREVAEIGAAVGNKMDKHLLEFHDNAIWEGSRVLTYEETYSLLMESPAFVVLIGEDDRAYHPNVVSPGQIVFASTMSVNGYPRVHRISLLASDTVTQTFGEAEKTSSRVSAIASADRANTTKYTSVKAVVDYVDGKLGDVETLLRELADRLEVISA